MNPNHEKLEDDKLDQLLADWSRRHEPSSDHLAGLRAKIFDEASPSKEAVVSPAAGAWRTSPAAIAVGAMIACSVLLAAMVFWRGEKEKPIAQPVLPPAAAQLPQAHLETLLKEMDRLFDERVAWVAETNQEVSLGLEDSRVAAGPHVAVRVVVLKRSESNPNQWRAIWTGDVVARSEEVVQLASTGDGSRLSLWTHVLPDGDVAIETELGTSGGVWTSTSVQASQVPQQVLSSHVGNGEFQVWQTAAVLQENAL